MNSFKMAWYKFSYFICWVHTWISLSTPRRWISSHL